jgi:uncharacterized protein (TIGR03437 family)
MRLVSWSRHRQHPGPRLPPAKPGEFVTIFRTGLGAVTPALASGQPGKNNNTVDEPTVVLTLGGKQSNTVTIAVSGSQAACVKIPGRLKPPHLAPQIVDP